MTDLITLDLAPSLRRSIIDAAPISGELSQWHGEPAVFTRRPTPDDAAYPFVLINPDAAILDQDGLTAQRPIVQRDIGVWGQQPDQYRLVERLGYALREHFHRKPHALVHPGYNTVLITVAGPTPAPADNADEVGRMIHLTIWLSKLP